MKILIADDHGLSREFIHTILKNMYSEAKIFEAEDYRSAECQCRKHQPALVILDVSMPGMAGLLGVLEITRKFPDSKVLICSAIDNPILIKTMLSFGVNGFISKGMSSKELTQGINSVLQGKVYIPDCHVDARDMRLTPRQAEMLGMLCSGLSNREIAKQLDISVHTVKLHVSSVLEILGAENRMQAIALCGLYPVGIT